MNKTLWVKWGLAAATALALTAQGALAQNTNPNAGGKITGERYWPARAATRHIEAARSYAQDFQRYVAAVPQPAPSVVKDIKTELGRYLEEAKKHLATMKKDAEGDKEVVAAVEKLEKDLATAIEHNKAMITCCENQTFDKVGAMACCTDLVKQLDKIHGDHLALMKKLTPK